jgi:DNA-binding CsgD family transcriptional regulator
MARFSPKDRTEFLAIKAACYRGLTRADLLGYLGARLGDYLQADATCMVQLDLDTALPVYVVSQGWSDDAHRPLVEHALLATPTADPGILAAQGRRTVVTEALVPAGRPYYRDPYFEYHVLWGGYRHELQTMCATAKRGRALLTVARRATTGSFEPRHLRLLDAIAPHVAAGMHAATVRESLAAPLASSTGFIVLDQTGKVELANAAGERWLARVDVLGRSGHVWAVHVLAAVLARGLKPDGAADVPELELNDPSTGALHRLHAERTVDANGAERTLILIEPVRRVDRPQTLQRFGLTQREAEVALGLLRGIDVSTLARELGVSSHTIVHHRRSVFDKLGVSSRRGLLARLYAGF